MRGRMRQEQEQEQQQPLPQRQPQRPTQAEAAAAAEAKAARAEARAAAATRAEAEAEEEFCRTLEEKSRINCVKCSDGEDQMLSWFYNSSSTEVADGLFKMIGSCGVGGMLACFVIYNFIVSLPSLGIAEAPVEAVEAVVEAVHESVKAVVEAVVEAEHESVDEAVVEAEQESVEATNARKAAARRLLARRIYRWHVEQEERRSVDNGGDDEDIEEGDGEGEDEEAVFDDDGDDNFIDRADGRDGSAIGYGETWSSVPPKVKIYIITNSITITLIAQPTTNTPGYCLVHLHCTSRVYGTELEFFHLKVREHF